MYKRIKLVITCFNMLKNVKTILIWKKSLSEKASSIIILFLKFEYYLYGCSRYSLTVAVVFLKSIIITVLKSAINNS